MSVPCSRPWYNPSVILLLTLFAAMIHCTSSSDGNLFDTLDQNHNGQLSKDEFDQGLLKFQAFLQGEQPHPHALNPGDAAALGVGGELPFPTFTLQNFWKGFTSALAMIIATEIGDKTFFIAAVLSMKHSRSAVFGGAILALIIMTILSTAMGLVLPQLIPRRYTHLVGGMLFLYFGFKLLADGSKMEAGKASDELEEVEEELFQQTNKKGDEEEGGAGKNLKRSPSSGVGTNTNNTDPMKVILQKTWYQVAIQALTLTFLAEWGDRSQIATIALAASKNPLGVTIGGCLGHALCTGLAVVGGRILAARISEKSVCLGGGLIFCFFGLHALFFEE